MSNISKSKNEYSFIYSSILLIFITFLLISFLPDMSYADRIWVSFISAKGGSKDGEMGAPPEISIIESNENHTLVHVLIPGMWVDTIMGPDGNIYQVLEVPDYATTNDVGKPELPAIRGLLGIPDNADVSMIPQVFATQILDNYYVWPHQEPVPIGEEWQFEKDEEFYNSDSWFPEEHREVGEPGIFKYYTVENVGYVPFKYNPYLRQLKVNPYIRLRVDYTGGGAIPIATMDEDMANLMRGVIWNFDSLNPNIDNTAPVYYLIITLDYLYERVLEYSNWLRTIYPYNIDVVKLSDIGNNPDCYIIKKYIEGYYYSHNSTDYVLFIGGTGNGQIPVMYVESPLPELELGEWGKIIPSDYNYTFIKGNDLFPEIALGRILFSSYQELDYILNKNIRYYTTDPLPPPGFDWRENVLLVAHINDNNFNFSDMANDIADRHYKWFQEQYGKQPNFIKCYGSDGYENKHIKLYIDNGVSSVCYFGHGVEVKWQKWSCFYEDWFGYNVDSLENYYKFPIVFNEACLNARIVGGVPLAEDWVNRGNSNNYIAAIASQGYSHLYFGLPKSDFFSYALYYFIYNQGGSPKGIGWLINCSNNYSLIVNSSNYYKHNVLSSILIGDPALKMRIKTTSSKYNNEKLITDNLNEIPISVEIENPISNTLNIIINSKYEDIINIEMYDISGRRIANIFNGKINGEVKITYDVNDIQTGLYIIRITNNGNNIYKKVVVIK